MEKIRISAIAAIGGNREIGKENDLIWKLDADFDRMKELIKGHPLVMGRKTYESIGKELPNSPSIVITRNINYISPYPETKHTFIVTSLEEALEKAREIEQDSATEEKEVFVFGGGQVYEKALPETDRLYLTEIDETDEDADAFFPDYTEFTKIINEIPHEENGVMFKLVTLERAEKTLAS